MLKKLNNRGFGIVGVLFILAILTVLVGTGWYVWQAQNDLASDPSETEITPIDQVEPVVERSGFFADVDDKTGSGAVSLLRNEDGSHAVVLGDDFVVQEGPDLFVSFANDGEVDQDTLFAELESLEGGQEYSVPAAIDVNQYNQVMIYCKEFSTPFAVADLQ